MDSSKRRRVDDGDNDRLSDLPNCLLLDILSHVGSRVAVQTGSLSRRWRHLWRDVPCADIDEREFSLAAASSNRVTLSQRQQQWARFEDFADHVLLPSSSSPLYQHRRLDAFRLHIASRCPYITPATTGRWVRRGLARSPAAVSIHSPDPSAVRWIWINPSASCLSRLTKLHLVGITITSLVSPSGQILGCPALEDLHMERCGLGHRFGAMASPVLRRLAVVRPIGCHLIAADLIRAAPRLEYLRLDLLSNGHLSAGEPAPEGQARPQPSVAEASIRISQWDNDVYHYSREREINRLRFCRAMCSLLARFPNVVCLHLSGFTTTALLEEKSHEFPTLNQLRTLVLDDCELGPNFYTLSSSILRNTPKLETLGLHRCKEEYITFLGSTPKRRRTPSKRRGSTAATTLHQCNNLKLIEIKSRQDDVFQILGILSEVFEEMPLAQWRRVDQARDVEGLMTMQFHRTEQEAKLVES